MTSLPDRRRVVVTGMGAVTPCGVGTDALWDAVVAGQSAITRLDAPAFAGSPVRIGGQVRGFDPAPYVQGALARRISPVQQWAIAAADEAMRHAGIELSPFGATPIDPTDGRNASLGADCLALALPWPRERFAIIAATGSGPIDAMQAATRAFDAKGARAVPPTLAVYGAPDGAATLLAARYGAFGASPAVSATCASGAMGLGTALRWIRHGYADAVLVAGMEDCLGPINLAANARLHALAIGYEDHPRAACRPFDRARRGFVMASGACAMLLEAESTARARCADGSADIELAGYAATSDAWHATAPRPDGTGAARAMLACLADAGASVDTIDHINAHGTGTPQGDAAEIAALETVFGARGHAIPIAATKATTGHLLGAAGVAEAIVAARTLATGLVPPTRNLTDPEFPDWDIVANAARAAHVTTALSNSFGFGGHNAALLLRKRTHDTP
ncbi:MAG TPA: beta-ketoacyl-[acyl-carrier-protein] synthase family protein [Rhodanobacteraceae bacterium]|nr:beta-ketoacyl-[acyl-carrier-protein] synthase family protein [Rhodanobacteraceae bacterium]